jgi:acetyl esterase/lipase
MLIQAATGDHVLEDARRLTELATEQGVDARLELLPGTTHAFQLFWRFLPEAVQALEQTAAFLRDVRPAPAPADAPAMRLRAAE